MLDSAASDALAAPFTRLFPGAAPLRLASAWREFTRLYTEPHRRYHTLDHIAACFHELLTCGGYGEADRDVVDWAILCHDVFYDTRAVNNEKRSAVWARNTSRYLGRPELGEAAAPIIMLTAHRPGMVALSYEGAKVCDVDLSILGAAPDVFDEYERQIRAEYDWVPEADFRAGRIKVLRGILDGGPIYRGYIYQMRYQAAAETNLRRSIAKLESVATEGR